MRILVALGILAGSVSLLSSLLLIWSAKYHSRLSADSQFDLPQKIHTAPVPRIGGIAILAGMLAGMAFVLWYPEAWVTVRPLHPDITDGSWVRVIAVHHRPPFGEAIAGALLLGLVPVFAAGLAEDLTKRVHPAHRLVWLALGAVAIVASLELGLRSIHLPFVDKMLDNYPVSLALTVFCCVGAANAYNIVDGLNGLLAGVSLITLCAIALVSWQVGDAAVLALTIILCGSVLGWIPFNWPRARLFAGDGGAYLLGFVSAALLLLLVARNPSVSPWFGISAAILPIWETLFSAWRRFAQGVCTIGPDQLHLHQLLRWRSSRFLQWCMRHTLSTGKADGPDSQSMLWTNGSISPALWVMHGSVAIPASFYWNRTSAQLVLLGLFVVVYVVVYRRLLRARFGHSEMTLERAFGKIAGER